MKKVAQVTLAIVAAGLLSSLAFAQVIKLSMPPQEVVAYPNLSIQDERISSVLRTNGNKKTSQMEVGLHCLRSQKQLVIGGFFDGLETQLPDDSDIGLRFLSTKSAFRVETLKRSDSGNSKSLVFRASLSDSDAIRNLKIDLISAVESDLVFLSFFPTSDPENSLGVVQVPFSSPDAPRDLGKRAAVQYDRVLSACE